MIICITNPKGKQLLLNLSASEQRYINSIRGLYNNGVFTQYDNLGSALRAVILHEYRILVDTCPDQKLLDMRISNLRKLCGFVNLQVAKDYTFELYDD